MTHEPLLHVVADTDDVPYPTPLTRIEQIRDLKQQIAGLVTEHVQHLLDTIATTILIADEIAADDAFAPGIRDLASRLSTDAGHKAQTIAAIGERL